MKFFINIYLKLINNFWKLVLLKLAKFYVIALIENFKHINYLNTLTNETIAYISCCVYSVSIAFGTAVVVYASVKLRSDLNKKNELNELIDAEIKEDLRYNITFEALFICWGISMFIVSTMGLETYVNYYIFLKEIKFNQDCKDISKVLL